MNISLKPVLLILLLSILYTRSVTAQQATLESHLVSAGSSASLIIDDIVCRGNTTTECSFITNKYFQAAGDQLDPEEIADAKLRLGTLIQFQSVSVYLEKGKQRNHVVVVFDITEASNLFYELGFAAHSRTRTLANSDSFRIDNQDGVFTTKVTNFNFLGTAKELSLSASVDRRETDFAFINCCSTLNFTDTGAEIFEFLSDAQQTTTNNSVSLNLGYFDPHLLDSSHYYMSANINYHRSRTDTRLTEVFIEPQNHPINRERTETKSDWTVHSLLLGRRFARYSFIAIDAIHTSSDFFNDTDYGVTLGWNSEDDVLLPTKGSSFSTRLSKDSDLWQVDVNFKQNIALSPNKIASIGTNITRNLPNIYCNSCALGVPNALGATLTARYTDITPINKSDGEFSSWYVGALYGQNNISEDIFNHRYWNVSAGYTYQTDSMIYRFSLAYTDQEDH